MALLMARYGRRLGLTLGYSLATVGGILGVLAILQGSFPLLLVSSALQGVGRASGDQGRFVAGEIFPHAERARMIGRLVFAGTIGAVVGPVLVSPTGRLMESLGTDPDIGPWVALFVLGGLAALFIFFLLRPDPSVIAASISEEEARQEIHADGTPQEVRPLQTLLMLPKVQLAIVAVLISQTVMVVLMVMTPLHMDHHSYGRDTISMVIALHTLGMFGLSPLTGYLIDRFGSIPMLFAGALVLAASALIAPVAATEFVLAFALFLLGLGWNFGFVSGSSLLSDALQGDERSRVQGVNDSIVFFGAGLGSIGAGLLFASGGYQAVSVAGLVLIAVLVGMIWWTNRPELAPEAA
jgi:MFS family permease